MINIKIVRRRTRRLWYQEVYDILYVDLFSL